MIASLFLLLVLGLMSCALTTKEQRKEARQRFARFNPLFISIIVVGLAIIFWPRR